MQVAKWRCRTLKYVYGVLLALYLAAPAYAFTPAQVPLLSSPAVPPNVMLLVDNSGSMYNIIWSTAFDPSVNRAPISYYSTQCFNGFVIVVCPFTTTITDGATLSLSDINTTSLIGFSLVCAFGGYPIYRGNTLYCLRLPDPAGSGRTRYTADYLSWLIDQVNPNLFGVRDYTNGVIPNDYRMNVAKTVATNLVSNNLSLRIGLASFNEPSSTDSGPGGKIAKAVVDLSPVTANTYQPTPVTQAQATANIKSLKDSIAALEPTANTPLAETYYEITRYFRGMAPYYQSTPTTYTSPIQYRCQKNYGVVITDGLPTFDRTFPTNDPDDVADTSRSLPNWDLNAANDGTDLNGDDEGDRLYLDDLAKFAYDIDMRKASNGTDLTGKSWDTTGFNQQNMSTYTIGFTLLSNQMLIDAADNNHGHGKFYQTNDSAGLTSALNLALSDIYAKAGSGGGGASSSSTLSSGVRFYQTLYDPSDWHGTINAFNLDPATGAQLNPAVWSTDTTISSSSPGSLFESWNTATSAKIILDYANFSTAQKAVLDANLPTGVNGTNLIAWTKGTANSLLRTRTRLLGDVVNSPLTTASATDKTSADFTGTTTYSSYLTTKAASMNNTLLVNSNDGFFNVISAAGARLYAYMPSTVLPALATIASTGYGSGVHKFTVDGQIAVFDTLLGTSWRTVAFGGVGAGGKAYFAVKLFEGTANTIGALWEVRAPDTSTPTNAFNNLGYAYSKPDVARMVDGTSIVVFGNGYGSFTGGASLFVLNANTGALIREIPIPPQSGETDNGLSSVKLRVNSQGIVQAAYAGDLKGRMWKFDMSSAASTGWGVAFGGSPLFTAPSGAAQPITVQPLLLDHPSNGKLVYFGTGKFLESTDKTTNGQQAFYAIWDADGGTGGIVQSGLQVQSITGSVNGSGATYYTSTNNDVDWGVKKGWYLALSTIAPFIGERVIYPAQTTRGRILFTTAAVNSADPCESTGTGRVFQLDAAKGGMLNYQVLDTNGDGLLNAIDALVSGIAIGTGIPNLVALMSGQAGAYDVMLVTDFTGVATPFRIPGGVSIYQRIMWRQIQ